MQLPPAVVNAIMALTLTQVWDVDTGTVLWSGQHGTEQRCLYCVAIAANKSFVVSAGVDERVQIWDFTTGGTCYPC